MVRQGGDIDFGSRGGEELWASGGGKGGDRAQKIHEKGPKKKLFRVKKILQILKQFCANLGQFLEKFL